MSRKRDPWRKRMAGHILHIGFMVATAAWFTSIGVGAVLVSTPETGRHSHLIGWIALAVAVVVFVKTMDRWVRYAPTFFGFGIVGGWAILWRNILGRGHLAGNETPLQHILSALALVLLFIGCTLITRDLAKRPLQMIDRVGLVAFAAALVWAMGAEMVLTSPKGRATPWGPATAAVPRLGAGFGILLALWLYHRYGSEKAGSRRARRHQENEG